MTEKNDQLLQKYRSRVIRASVLKALCCGLIIGCALLFVSAAVCWFAEIRWGILLSLGLGLAAVVISVPAFYFLKFRPTAKAIAHRIDQLGLEERVLTMVELEKEDSYMAAKQREDTISALRSANHMLIRFVVTVAMLVSISVSGVLGVGMGTISVLYAGGFIPSGKELFFPSEEKIPGTYTVSYSIEKGSGSILNWATNEVLITSIKESGEESNAATGLEALMQSLPEGVTAGISGLGRDGDLSVDGTPAAGETADEKPGNVFVLQEGEDCIPVIAAPADGWVFVGWSDGVRNPYRYDLDVTEDIQVTALFEELDELIGEDDQAEGDEGDGSGENGEGEDNGKPGEPGEEESGPSDPNAPPSIGAGGNRDDASSQIMNGNTYYGDYYDDAYSDAMDATSGDDSIPEEVKDIIAGYYEGIEN